MMKLWQFAVVFLLFVSARALDTSDADADEEGGFTGPHVLIHKGLHLPDDNYMVVGREFTVSYTLVNVGTEAANNVRCFDSWPEEYFKMVAGDPDIKIATLDVGSPEVFNVTLVPQQSGKYTPERAKASYDATPEEGADEAEESVRNGFSSSFGEVFIVTQEQFTRATATYSAEWTVFLALCVGPIALPFFTWQYVHNARVSASLKRK